MSIQSTTKLTRQQAEERYVYKMLNDEKLKRELRARAVMMNDEELEDALEETFDNFLIVSDL